MRRDLLLQTNTFRSPLRFSREKENALRNFRGFAAALSVIVLSAGFGCRGMLSQSAEHASLPPVPHAKQIHLKHVLVIGQTKGFEHDSISAAMAAIYNMGKESGLWETMLRTD